MSLTARRSSVYLAVDRPPRLLLYSAARWSCCRTKPPTILTGLVGYNDEDDVVVDAASATDAGRGRTMATDLEDCGIADRTPRTSARVYKSSASAGAVERDQNQKHKQSYAHCFTK